MRLLKLLLLLMLPGYLLAQTTHGRIVDADDDKPIAGASIYLSGTYQGTTSDTLGRFELHTSEKNIPLMITCVGYSAITLTDYSGKNLKVLLKRKSNVLKEVTIGYDAMSREKEMKIFMREFFGDDHKCTIKNPDDITFTYHKKDDLLEGFAEQPLIIENKDLGYTITYFMDDFSYKDNSTGVMGNYYFKEDTAGLKPAEVKKILKARDKAYFGSTMHFIRSLWANNLDKQNFAVKLNGEDLMYKDLVLEINGEKYLKYAYQLGIVYNNYAFSTLQEPNSGALIFIAKNGFYDGGISWSGVMGSLRISVLLPYEFQPMKN